MHVTGLIAELVDYDGWANQRLAAVLASEPAPQRAHELFAHVLAAHEIWWNRIAGTNAQAKAWPTTTSGDLARHASRLHRRLTELLLTEDAESIGREIEYRDLLGNPHRTPLGEILLHLVNHGTHHRAQVATALKQNGCTPPRLDFIVFTRERREESA